MSPEGGNYHSMTSIPDTHTSATPPLQPFNSVLKGYRFSLFQHLSEHDSKVLSAILLESDAGCKGLIAHRVRYIRASCHQSPTSVALIRFHSICLLVPHLCLILASFLVTLLEVFWQSEHSCVLTDLFNRNP